jgi:NitT/TauT family transport system permease protein
MPSRVGRYLAPKESIPVPLYVSASTLTVAAALATWGCLSYGGLVDALFLPTPTQVVLAATDMIRDGSLWEHTRASTFVIFTGYLLSTVVAVPLGILGGSFKVVEALIEPVTGFFRYLPVSAMIPLLILWVGIDWESRVAVIFLGTFFQQVVLIADVSAGVSKDLLDVSYTLGAKRRHAIWRVLVPATLPGVLDNLRITMGWAWTYLVVAELVAASKGLGYAILNYMRGLFTAHILVGIVTIGLLGLTTDQLFKVAHRWLLPWSPRA